MPRHRRASATEPTTPISSAAPPSGASTRRFCENCSSNSFVEMPTLTMPNTRFVPGSTTGTLATIDLPSVPDWWTTSS